MKKLLSAFLFAAFLCALPAQAQTVANPSFEAPQPLPNASSLGPWEVGTIPNWTVTGSAGLWQPANYSALPDGKVVAFSNGGTLTQDLGVPAQANTIYTLSVYVGHRPDDQPTTFTISLGPACTFTGKTSDIPIGTFAKQTLVCPALTGNLVVTLSTVGAQANFDNVTLTSASAVTPQPISLTVKAMLLWCALCNQTDNVPVTGNLVIAQTGGPTATYNILSNGSVSASSIIDIAQDPLQFTLMLTDSTGAAQPGGTLTLTFPRFELASPGFTLGTISLGVVRLAHTTDSQGNPAVRIVDVSQFILGK